MVQLPKSYLKGKGRLPLVWMFGVLAAGTGMVLFAPRSPARAASSAGCLPAGSSRTFITFLSDRGGNRDIYVMRANGTNVTRLTNNASLDTTPALRGDRCKILFASNRGNGFAPHTEPLDMWIMRADGAFQHRLTSNIHDGANPSYSPDGTKIIFTATTGGVVFRKFNVYMMNADGSNLKIISNQDDADPVFSPNGQKIAVASGRETVPDDALPNTSKRDIYVMNSDGSGSVKLTSHPANDRHPDFSPNGQKIVFMSERDGNPEIYLMNANGSGQIRLTNNPGTDSWPVFSPNGQKIAWVSNRDGDNEIYTMNSDGTGQMRLTNNTADDNYPHWR